MKIRGNSYFLIVVMVGMLIVMGLSLKMEFFASKVLPLVFSSVGFVLAAVGLWREVQGGSRPQATVIGDKASTSGETEESWSRYLLNGAWLGGFVLGIYLLGFMVAIPLFLLSYIKWMGTCWRVAIIWAILGTALIYAMFELTLHRNLYQGLLFTWLGS